MMPRVGSRPARGGGTVRPFRDARGRATIALLSAAAPSIWMVAASAQSPVPVLPPVDLGQTNILDGEGKPGTVLELIAPGSSANRLATASGKSAAGRNEQRSISGILHPILVSPALWAGAHPGVEVLVPTTSLSNEFAAGGSGRSTGVGDVTVAPFLQWSDLRTDAGPVSIRLAVQVVAPTGDHDPARPVNTGQGSWQVSPYMAATWRMTDRWEVSTRLIYDWSGRSDGWSSSGSLVRLRPGDLAVVDASASYAVSPDWRLGLGGYMLRQLGNSTIDGSRAPGGRQQVVSLGPVSRGQVGDVAVLAAAYCEFGARNRPEGFNANVRLQMPF